MITGRSRVLSPLQARIVEVEEAITRFEGIIERDTQALVDASVKGDGESIKQLSRSVHEARSKIDPLFDELEALTAEAEARSREFDEKLEELKAAGG